MPDEPIPTSSAVPEMSRPFAADRLGGAAATIVVEADATERLAVARRLGVASVASLRCRWILRGAAATDRIDADGLLECRLTQDCVVTLEPFEAGIVEAFTVVFVPEAALGDDDDPEAPDELPFDGQSIDLGEATVEQLALALDPFPRAPGAELDPTATVRDDHPFAALRARLPRA